MKNFITNMMLCTSSLVMSQIPQAFAYQGVVMDASGETSTNKNARLKITLVDANQHQKEIYSEMHHIESNSQGLFNIDVGSGIPLAGSFNTHQTKNKTHYVKVEIDTTGQSNYEFAGTVAFGQFDS